MGTMASQITSLTIVYPTVYSGADQRKHQSSASLAFVRELTGEFSAQMASNEENVSIWWRHHVFERMRSDIPPPRPMITHTSDSRQIPSENKTKTKLQI